MAANDWWSVAGGSVVGGGNQLSESVGIRGAQSEKKGLWTLKGRAGEFKQTTGGCCVQLALEGITSNPDGDSRRGELVVSGGREARKAP